MHRLSVSTVSETLGVSAGTISETERGNLWPSVELAARIRDMTRPARGRTPLVTADDLLDTCLAARNGERIDRSPAVPPKRKPKERKHGKK